VTENLLIDVEVVKMSRNSFKAIRFVNVRVDVLKTIE